MYRHCLPIVVLLSAGCLFLKAQVPPPPFTGKDLQLGKQLLATAAEIHAQVTDPSGPAEPFKVIGNLYFVGANNGGAYLLTSPQGHILLGAGFVDSSEGIRKNIESLGFKMTDIKVILLNHSHPDAAGGAFYMKEKTGAQVMAGFAEIPFLEHRNQPPPAPNAAGRGPARGADGGQGIQQAARPATPVPSVKVDRALYDGDVVNVGPISVTTYLAPGHSASSASWLFTIKDGNHTYRAFEFCCWEYPDDLNRNVYINEASVRHTFETWKKILPVDIYLENGLYGWGGLLNQPSGTIKERMAGLKANGQLAVNPSIFRAFAAAREVDFEEKLAKLKTSSPSR